MIAGELEIRLRADIARLQRDMDDARRVVGGAVDGITRAATIARNALAGMAAGLSLGALAHQVVDAQREFDKLNASLITATGSTANAAGAFKALQAFASTTPYSVAEATEAFIKMRNLGLDPSEKALRSYGNTAAAMGKGLNQMIEAVADAATGEFERLKEFGITAKQNGDKVGLTFKGMTANIGNNAKEIQEYLRKLGETDFAGAMERRAATLDGAISNLGDTWDSTMRTIATNGIGQTTMSAVMGMSGALQDLAAILDVVGGKAKDEGKAVSEAGTLHKIMTAVFETMAVLGVNVAYVFEQIGTELGGLAAQASLVLQGDLKGAAAVGDMMKKDAAAARKAVDEKSAAILGAAQKAQDAQVAEAEQMKKSGADRLGQYQVELTAEQKRAKAKQDVLEIENRLNGVNAQTAGELVKMKAALDAGAISQAEYAKYTAKINKEARENSTAYKDAVKQIDLQTAALQRQAAARNYDNQQAQQQIDFLKRTGQMDEEDAINKGADADLEKLRKDKAAVEQQIKLQSQKIGNEEKIGNLRDQRAQLDKDIDARELKRGNDLFELDQKRYRQNVAGYADLVEAAQAESKAQQDQVRDQQDYIDSLGMTEKQLAALTATRLRDQAAKLDELAALRLMVNENDELGIEYRKQAEALKQRAANTVFAEELKHQKEIWSSIEQTAHDTFVSIFDSGKSAFDRLRDALKNGLLDLLYQMTLKKWIISLQVDVTGGLLGGAASAAGSSLGAGSSLTSAAGLANAAANVYKAISGGFESLSTSVADAVQAGLYKSGLSPNIASNGAFANGAGAAAGYAAGAAAGIYGGRAISGGYAVTGSGNGLVNVGTLAGAVLGGPIGGAIGGLIAGGVNSLFGRKAPEIQSQGLRGSYGADGNVSGETYQNILEKGGLFRSDKRYTNTQALTEEMQSQIGQSFKAITDASSVMAKSLGLGADTLVGYSKKFDVTLTSDAAKNQEAMTAFFGGVADEVATKLVPNLASFSQSGETASATLQRLAGEFDATTTAMMNIGKTAEQAFGDAGIASAAARERLVQLAGGTSALTSLTSSYAQNFLTEAQRLEPVSKALDEALGQLGLSSIPTTRQEFAKLASGLDLTNEAQAKQFVGLMQLNEAFALVHPETATNALAERQKLQDELDELTMSSTQLLDKQRAALDESNRALFDQVQAVKAQAAAVQALKDAASTLLGGVDSAYSVLEKVVSREKAAVQSSVDAHSAAVTKLQSLSQALHSTFDSMQSPDQKLAARAAGQEQIRAALAAARAGGALPTADSLKDALSAVQQDASDQFSSYTDYLRDLYTTQNDIGALAGITDDQLSVEEKALAAAQDQLQALDAVLSNAQQQIDEMKGQSTTLLSIADAIRALAGAMQAAQANPVVSAGSAINKAYQTYLGRAPDAQGLEWWTNAAANGAPTSQIVDGIKNSTEANLKGLYESVLGRAPDAEGLAFWMNAYGPTMSEAEKADFMKAAQAELQAKANGKQDDFLKSHGVPGYANGGDFAGGVRLVGEIGPEVEATGASRIHSTQSLMDALRNPSSNNDVLAAAVERLTATVDRQNTIIEQQGAALDQIQRNTRRQADTLEVVTEGGNAMRTSGGAN